MFTRQLLRVSRRAYSTSPSTLRTRTRDVTKLVAFGTTLGLGAVTVDHLSSGPGIPDSPVVALGPPDSSSRSSRPLHELARAYIVYTLCAIPGLVDAAPTLLDSLLRVPVLSHIAEATVRATFFGQFVGADTADACVPLLRRLRAEGVGCLFAYSVEVDDRAATGGSSPAGTGAHVEADESAPHHQRAVEEIVRSIDVAADFEDAQPGAGGRKTWVAVKLTALVPDADALVRLSAYLLTARTPLPEVGFPGAPRPDDLAVLATPQPPHDSTLTMTDLHALAELRDALRRVCAHARARRVKLILDAEYTWYQPAVDAFALALMREFNASPSSSPSSSEDDSAVQPVVYQTFQAYLRRTPAYLAHALTEAREGNFALGAKLVRGAYHPHEAAAHTARPRPPALSSELAPPVWSVKAETDACYNACVRVLVRAVADSATVESPVKKEGGVTPARGWLDQLWRVPLSLAEERKPPVVAVLFGTHNRASCATILSALVDAGLASRDAEGRTVLSSIGAERVALGQLYGMHDALTDELASALVADSPVVLKYVPYGALREVMPYLGRRAIENRSVLTEGVAADERRQAGREIRARLFGR